MDILGSLPVEIAERILMYLKPDDLARCSGVCKNWYFLANNDRCWQLICKDFNLEGDEMVYSGYCKTLGPASRWKEVYKRHATLVKNWGKNQYRLVNIRRHVSTDVLCSSIHNSLIVLGFSNGEVSVYNMGRTRVTHVQTFGDILDEGDQVTLNALVVNSKIIAAKFGSVTLIYLRAGEKFNFSHVIYTIGGKPKLRCSERKKMISYAVTYGADDYVVRRESMGLAGNILFVMMRDTQRMFLWDYIKMEYKADILIDGTDCCRVQYFKEKMYLGTSGHIMVYNKDCKKELSIEAGSHIDTLLCNKNIILCQLRGDRLCTWNRHTGERLFDRIMSIPEYSVLHPYEDIVIYLLYSRRPPPEHDKREIKAFDLKTGNVCWKSEVQKSHFNVMGHAFHIFVGRYLLFYAPAFGHLSDTWSVYDISNGKYMYEVDIEERFDISFCFDSLLIMRNDYGNKVRLHLYT